jgi:PilZ domain
MAVYKETRRYPRYQCDTGVRISVEKQPGGFWGTLSDISLGGCYIYTFSPLPLGQAVVLVIKAGAQEVQVDGTIVSSHPGVGMGVAFRAFSYQDGESILKSYLTHLASQPKSQQAQGVFH